MKKVKYNDQIMNPNSNQGEIIMAEVTEERVREIAEQIAQQAAQSAASQAAAQVAQQINEQISDAVSSAIQKLIQTSSAATTSARIENADIGGSERLEKDQMSDSGILFLNQKRTFDEFQHESLESLRRNRTIVDKQITNGETHTVNINNVALQAVQNAVETANLVGKQAVRHAGIEADRIWNINETDWASIDVAKAAAGDTTAQAALKDLIVQAVGDVLDKRPATA